MSTEQIRLQVSPIWIWRSLPGGQGKIEERSRKWRPGKGRKGNWPPKRSVGSAVLEMRSLAGYTCLGEIACEHCTYTKVVVILVGGADVERQSKRTRRPAQHDHRRFHKAINSDRHPSVDCHCTLLPNQLPFQRCSDRETSDFPFNHPKCSGVRQLQVFNAIHV